MRAVAARGLNCPDDVSITGHNDMPLVDMVEPPLTTIRICHDLIGREGARLLLERIAQPELPPAQILTSSTLILRASTAPPRESAAKKGRRAAKKQASLTVD